MEKLRYVLMALLLFATCTLYVLSVLTVCLVGAAAWVLSWALVTPIMAAAYISGLLGDRVQHFR